MMEVGGEDREAIAGGDKKMITHDHVAIAITIGGGSECRCAGLIHPLGEGMSMNQVRVRMAATKVFKRYGIHDRADGGAKTATEEAMGIGTGDRMHGIEHDRQPVFFERLGNQVKIKQFLHEFSIVGHRINDL